MGRTSVAIVVVGILLYACATPAPGPTATPTRVPFAPSATAVSSTEVPVATPTHTPTSPPTTTPTPEPTSTPTSIPTCTLSGTVFFDYNGNGLRDGSEPPIEGVPIRVASLTTASGPDGSYSLSGVPAGSQQVYVESRTQGSGAAFKYVSLSVQAFQMIDRPIAITTSGDRRFDVALMEGFLTLPVACGSDAWLGSHVDLDYALGAVRNYAGDSTGCNFAEGVRLSGTCDNHQGVDWMAPEGTPLLAAAPGTVIDVWEGGDGGAKQIRLLHDAGGRKFVSDYGHNQQNLVDRGQKVARGEVIAVMGRTGCDIPHVHFNFWEVPEYTSHNGHVIDYVFEGTAYPSVQYHDGTSVTTVLDPFRDVLDSLSESFWTKDNDPQCLP